MAKFVYDVNDPNAPSGVGPQPEPTPPTPPPIPVGGEKQIIRGCQPGTGLYPACSNVCRGGLDQQRAICPNTFCQFSVPAGSSDPNTGRWEYCQAPIGYQPQFPAVNNAGVIIPPASPPSFQEPPAGAECPPGEELKCADALPNNPLSSSDCPDGYELVCDDGVSGLGQIINPSNLPLVVSDNPMDAGNLAAALPSVINVAVQGWGDLVDALNNGLNRLIGIASQAAVETTLPVQGSVGRIIDGAGKVCDKLCQKLTGQLWERFGEAAAYAGQLGVPPPTQQDKDAIAAGQIPPSSLTGRAAPVVLTPPTAAPAGPSLHGITPLPAIGDTIGDGSGDVGAGGDFTPPGLPIPAPPRPFGDPTSCEQTEPGVWHLHYADGGEDVYFGPDPPANCPTYGGYGPDGNPQPPPGGVLNPQPQPPPGGGYGPQQPPGGVLNPQPGGGLVPGPGGTLNPQPPGGLNPQPGGGLNPQPGGGGGNCPPPVVNCGGGGNVQPGGQLNNINVNVPGGGNIVTSPPGGGGGGTLNNQTPPVNVIVNVPPAPGQQQQPQPFGTDNSTPGVWVYTDFNNPDACNLVAVSNAINAVSTHDIVVNNLGFNGSPADPIVPQQAADVMASMPWWFPNKIFWALCRVVVSVMNPAASYAASSFSSATSYLAQGFASSMITGWAARITGGDFSKLDQRRTITQNLLAPSEPPSAADASLCYFAGEIDENAWRCWVRANNICDIPYQTVLHASRTRPGVAEILSLWMRGQIDDPHLSLELRNLGVIDAKDRARYKALAQFIPSPGEVIDGMIGKRFDNDFAEQNDLDHNFADRYTDKAKEYLTAHGISEEQAKLLWRMRIRMPDDNALIEMLFRLRPGADNPAGSVTEDDIRSALQNNGMAANWVDRYIAVSRPRITLRELRNLVIHAGWDEKKLTEAFKNLGYPDEQATDLAKGYYGSFIKGRLAEMGVPTEAEITKLYREDSATREKATDILKMYGHDDDAVKQILDIQDEMLVSTMRAQNIKAVKARYMKGEYRDDEAITALLGAGLTADRANKRVGYWRTERDLDFKLPSTQQLCAMYTDGFIDLSTYMRRMTNLGYSESDAKALVGRCVIADTTKRAAEIKKEMKEQEAAIRQQISDAKKAAKEAAAAAKANAKCKPPPKPTCPS